MEPNEVGTVKVSVSSKQVHNAVRNILANEMSLDVHDIRKKSQEKAEELIRKEVLDYLAKKGFGTADLDCRAKLVMQHYEDDLKKRVKEVLKEVVAQIVREEVESTVEAVIREGVELRVAWNKKVKLKVEPKE